VGDSWQNKEGLQKLTETLYAFIGHEGSSNYGFWVTEKGVVVIDNDIRTVDRLLEGIKQTTKKEIKFLINTHHDFDHTSANHIFAERGVMILSSTRCRECLAEMGEKKFGEMRTSDERIWKLTQGIRVTLPDMTFNNHLSLHFGSDQLELIHFDHGHTPGDVIVYYPKEKIVFTGDLFFNKYYPQSRQGNLNHWIQFLEQLSDMPIEIVIPGHGLMIKGKEGFQTLKEYFLKVKSSVEEMVKRGKKLEEIQKELVFPEYQDWGKTPNLSITIEKFYKERVS
jgi:cyclase